MKAVIVGVVIVLLLALGAFVAISSRNTSSTNPQVTGSVSPTVNPENSLNSLRDLLSSRESQACSFSTEMGGHLSEGTVYVANGKMRGDFTSEIEGKTLSSHMIISDNTTYMWTDGQKQGIKTTLNDEELGKAEDLANQAKLDLNAEVDYDCESWSGNNTYYDLPQGVEFTSIGELMQNIPTGTSEQCAACSSLSGDTKSQCLAALKCN